MGMDKSSYWKWGIAIILASVLVFLNSYIYGANGLDISLRAGYRSLIFFTITLIVVKKVMRGLNKTNLSTWLKGAIITSILSFILTST